jgi:hypothetical protein
MTGRQTRRRLPNTESACLVEVRRPEAVRMDPLFSYCIHTFRHSDELRKQASADGSHTLTERKPWVTGRQLWVEAVRSGERMPVLFSGADVHTGLFYWATIDDITIDEEKRTTICSYSNLRKIEPVRRLSELRLRKGGRQLSDNLIRPYAICHTPRFLV